MGGFSKKSSIVSIVQCFFVLVGMEISVMMLGMEIVWYFRNIEFD